MVLSFRLAAFRKLVMGPPMPMSRFQSGPETSMSKSTAISPWKEQSMQDRSTCLMMVSISRPAATGPEKILCGGPSGMKGSSRDAEEKLLPPPSFFQRERMRGLGSLHRPSAALPRPGLESTGVLGWHQAAFQPQGRARLCRRTEAGELARRPDEHAIVLEIERRTSCSRPSSVGSPSRRRKVGESERMRTCIRLAVQSRRCRTGGG